MKSEILTYPLTRNQLLVELNYFVEYFTNIGYDNCNVLFGFGWGNEYYPTANWKFENIALSNLVEKVNSIERKGFGEIGLDDLFMTLTDLSLEFQFCNDSDIHIRFNESSKIVEQFYERWKVLGYSPAEWEHDEKGKPTNRIRLN